MNQKATKRIGLTMLILLLCICLLIAHFVYSYLYLPYYDPNFIQERKRLSFISLSKNSHEGTYFDKNNEIIFSNGKTKQQNAYSLSWLLGYYQVDNKNEYKIGLRGNLVDYTYLQLDKNKKGADVFLTIDHHLQNFAYQLLNHKEGSITILDAHNGAILALASQSTFDFNINNLNSLSNANKEASLFTRGLFEKDPPGSTFKVITAIAALSYPQPLDFSFNDLGSYKPQDGKSEVINFNHQAYGKVNLEKALNYSINTYFAQLGEKIGNNHLTKVANQFMIGKNINIPFLSTIHSHINIDSSSELAASAYGQGKLQMTPFHLAMIAQSLANKGIMKEAFIVNEIKNSKKVFYKHQEKNLSEVCSADIIAKLNPYLASTAKRYGLYKNIYAKTGTAELPDGTTHIYLLAYNQDYAMCISLNHQNNSSRLIPIANKLFNYLNNYK